MVYESKENPPSTSNPNLQTGLQTIFPTHLDPPLDYAADARSKTISLLGRRLQGRPSDDLNISDGLRKGLIKLDDQGFKMLSPNDQLKLPTFGKPSHFLTKANHTLTGMEQCGPSVG